MKRGVVLLLLVLVLASGGLAGARHLRRRSQLAKLPPVPTENVAESVQNVLKPLHAAVVADPTSADAWGTYGEALCANDFFPAAIVSLGQAQVLNPASPIWPHLEAVCVAVTDKKAAAVLLRRAIELNPAQVVSLCTLAESLIDEGKDDEAYKLLKQAEQMDPRDPRILYGLARLDLKAGRAEPALQRIEPLLRSLPNRSDVRRLAVQVYRRLNRAKDADRQSEVVGMLPKATDSTTWTDPILASAYRFRRGAAWMAPTAAALIRSGRATDALEYLNDLSPAEREDPRVQAAIGKAQIYLRQLDEAQKTLQGSLAKDPKYAAAHFELGTLSMLREKWEDGAASFIKALESNPDMDVAAYDAALCYQQVGKKDLVIKYMEKAAAANPANTDALKFLAAILLDKGDKKGAKVRIDAALLLMPDDADLKEMAAKANAK